VPFQRAHPLAGMKPIGRFAGTGLPLILAVLLSGCGGDLSPDTRSSLASGGSPWRSSRTAPRFAPRDGSARWNRRKPRPASGKHPPRLPLIGRIVGIDPGHNGGNFADPAYIDHLIWNGREMEACNTTGTETDSGYTEAQFNFAVANFLASDLRQAGARIVMTRHSNDGVGPCVDERAHIIDHAYADVAVDIHADGGPASGRGVAILEPVADGINGRIIGASVRFGHDVLEKMETVTGMPPSTYDGVDGIVFRDDLAGLNLTTVPEVLIESGNMRNPIDAALLTSPRFQRLEARALDLAILKFLSRPAS
jgi:N-acetylmuramoyl-L-alanine amidase